jgi:hypothetical protein
MARFNIVLRRAHLAIAALQARLNDMGWRQSSVNTRKGHISSSLPILD